GARVLHEPAQRQGGAARGTHLDRHLVGRTTDTTAADLEGRLDVVERALQRDDRVVARLLAAALKGAVDDRLRDRTLAVQKNLVDQRGDQRGAVNRVSHELTAARRTLARHS